MGIIAGFFFNSLFMFMGPPGPAEALSSSRISAAKGNGLMSLVQKWNSKYAANSPAVKYQNEKEVVGYYTKDWPTDTLSQNSLNTNASRITTVATFAYKLQATGELVGETPVDALKTAANNSIQTLALVHNLSSAGFDRSLIHSILNDSELKTKTITNIYQVVTVNGFDGVNIDFENVRPGDREALNSFMTELRDKLAPDNLAVTISVPAKTADNPSDGWSGGFDYKYLATVTDRIMIMSYDEHWIGGDPGPVASQPWVEKVAAYAVKVIPKEKVLLGIGNYGYDWIVGKGWHKTVLARNAVSMAEKYGSKIEWDNTNQTPYFYYWDNDQKHVVWFESTESAGFKLDLVNKYDLKGIAMWRLGFEPVSFWDMIEKKLGKLP